MFLTLPNEFMNIWEIITTADLPSSSFFRRIQFVCDEWMLNNDMIPTDPYADSNSAMNNAMKRYMWQMFVTFYYTITS